MNSLTIRLPDEIAKRLSKLAKRTHRTKTYYALEALITYLEDLEDTYLALERLKEPGETIPMEEVIRELSFTPEERKEIGLDD